jgi:flagellar export protein FliJ
MSRFHFSLEPLLRLRRLLEEQQYMVLQRANQKINLSQQQLTIATQQLRSAQNEWLAQMTTGATGAELQYMRECEGNRKIAIEQHQIRHQQLVTEMVAAREIYLRLRRESEVVQHLRDRAWEKWKVEQARREQQQLDEIFLMRSGRRAPMSLRGGTAKSSRILPSA